MPDTRSGSIFKEGVCQACLNYDKRKKIDWNTKLKELRTLLFSCNTTKEGEYACAIPVSGGKDSHYLVWLVKEHLGINPLLIRVGDGFGISEAGKHNIRNLGDRFDCNLIEWTPSIKWYRDIIRKQFETLGNFPIVDQLIYTIPYNICSAMKIPLLIWGEDPNFEYGTSEVEVSGTDYIARMFKTIGTVPFKSDSVINIIFASHYVAWSSYGNYELAKKYGFKDLEWNPPRKGTIEGWDSIDCVGWQVSNILKMRKMGYGRASDILSRLIREGRISREESLKLAENNDIEIDERIVEDFLSFTGYSRKEFDDILDKWTNRKLFYRENGEWKLKPVFAGAV